MRIFVPLFILFQIFIACTNIQKGPESNRNCISDSMAKLIKLDSVRKQPVQEEIKLTGKISYNEDKVVRLYPPVGGLVQKLTVSLGDFVTKGQVLAEIRSADMAAYSSQYQTAIANLNMAKKTLEVTAELAKTGVYSQKDLMTAKQNYEIALNEVNRSKRVSNIFGDTSKEIYYMRSPITGYIVEKKISDGMTLRTDNSDYVFMLSDLNEVWVLANLYEIDIDKVKVGYEAEIKTLSYDKIYTGKVDKIFNVVDPVTKTLKARIKLNNADYSLKPEMFARVTIHFEENTVRPYVPSKSIIFDKNKYFVMIYHNRCQIETREINTYWENNDTTYISAGVSVGERVISKLQLLIYDQLND